MTTILPVHWRDTATEAEFLASVVQEARFRGWLTFHALVSRGSAHGLPDVILCRPPVLRFIELKSARGHPTAAQLRWVEALDACTEVHAGVFWPRDRERISRILAGEEQRA